MKPILLRPHHLVNGTYRYLRYDRGMDGGHEFRQRSNERDTHYDPRFHQLEDQSLRAIIDNQDIPIQITDTWDDWCQVCSQKPSCTYEHESERDVEKVKRLGLNIGDVTTSGYVVAQILGQSHLDELVALAVKNSAQ